MKTRRSLLTVIAQDRAGIISQVTEVLFRRRCNLEDISMTVLEDQLAMMLVLTFAEHAREPINAGLDALGKRAGLSFAWKDLPLQKKVSKPAAGQTYLISAIGPDRTGLVYEISRILAKRGLNIMDLNSRIVGRTKKEIYAMALEVDIPPRFKIELLRKDLLRASKRLQIDITLKSVEAVEF